MSKLKSLFVLVCMTLGLTSIVEGQVYSSGYYYYHSETNDYMAVIKFNGRTAIFRSSSGANTTEEIVRTCLKQDPNWYEKDFSGDCIKIPGRNFYYNDVCQDIYEYDATKGDYTIYKNVYDYVDLNDNTWIPGEPYPRTKQGIRYIAVSSDKKTILKWSNSSEKTKFVKVDKNFYLPKDDFFDE